MYFALPWETRDDGDTEPSPLGSLLAMEPDVIVEMKWYGELPHWAIDLHAYLKENTREERPSKFIVAMRWLLGETNGHKAKKRKRSRKPCAPTLPRHAAPWGRTTRPRR